jgi:F0F1-type ATP synthase membrane subunit b/b'
MNKRSRVIVASVVLVVLVVAGAMYAQKPARNISGERHPNLAAAQRLLNQAYEKVVAAQTANEWDLGGHASKAKALIEQADAELKLAAETANQHPKK